MNESKVQKYYYLALVAYVIPIIGYICIPGLVGVFALTQSFMLIITYRKMMSSKCIRKPMIDKHLKHFGWIVLMGVANFLIFGNHSYINISLMISSLLGYLGIIYAFMIDDISSVRYFIKSCLWILIPTAIFSKLKWEGFFSFDPPHIISPVALFVLFCPFFRRKTQFFLYGILFFSVASDVSVRSCLLTFVFCSVVLACYLFFSKNIFIKIIKKLRIVLFIMPLVLVVLGVCGTYNVFSSMESQDVSAIDMGSGRKSMDRALNTDSRTVVYEDVRYSINGISDLLFGKGEVINLESSWIETRHSVEAGILNVFLRYGLVGCFFFFLLLLHASKLGINKTNNTFTKLAALYLAYKFMFMFMGDSNINLSTYIAYGICMCDNIRQMDDKYIKSFFSDF